MTDRQGGGKVQGGKVQASVLERRALAAVLALVAGFGSRAAAADPLQVGVGVQERFSDNIRLSHTNRKADLETRTFLTLNQQSTSGKCQSNLGAELGYREYLENSYAGHTDINGQIGGDCILVDGLSWNAQDNINQVLRNSTLPNTPNNSVRRNIFSTGPTWQWRLNPQDTLTLSSSYQKSSFWGSSQPTSGTGTGLRNNHRYLGSANFRHQWSPSLALGFGGDISRTYYENDETLTVRSGNLNFDKTFKTTTVSGSVGYSTLEDDYGVLSSRSGGVIWHAQINRQITERSNWYFSYDRRFTDTSSAYVLQIAGLLFNYQQTTAVKVTAYRTGYNNRFSDGSSVAVSLGRDESDYLQTGVRDITNTANLEYTVPVATEWTGTAGLGYHNQKAGETGIKNDTYNVYVGTSYQRTRALSFNAQLGHNLRRSSDSPLSYEENFALVGVRYDFQ